MRECSQGATDIVVFFKCTYARLKCSSCRTVHRERATRDDMRPFDYTTTLWAPVDKQAANCRLHCLTGKRKRDAESETFVTECGLGRLLPSLELREAIETAVLRAHPGLVQGQAPAALVGVHTALRLLR